MLTMCLKANRTLEDMDAYYRSNPSLIVIGDRDVITRTRPQKYTDREAEALESVERLQGTEVKT